MTLWLLFQKGGGKLGRASSVSEETKAGRFHGDSVSQLVSRGAAGNYTPPYDIRHLALADHV